MLRTLVALDMALVTLVMQSTSVGDLTVKDPAVTRWSAKVQDYRAAGLCALWEVVGPLPDWVFDEANRWHPAERLDMDRICPEGSRGFVGPPTKQVTAAQRRAFASARQLGRKP